MYKRIVRFKINAVTRTLCMKISNEKLRYKQVKFSLNKIKIKIFRVKVFLIQAHPYSYATPRGLIESENCGKLIMKS